VREEGNEEIDSVLPDTIPAPVKVDDSGHGQSAELAAAARQVAEASANQRSLTDRILARLKADEVSLRGDLPHPDFVQAIESQDFRDVLRRMDEIVSRYDGGEFLIQSLDADIMRLGAFLFYLSGRVNNVEMSALDAETALKASIGRAFLKAKNIASEESGRLSDEAAKHIAIVATDDIRAGIGTQKVIAHTAKGLYYAGAQLLKMMNEISNRAHRERMRPGQL
jgi:hypothetical protein